MEITDIRFKILEGKGKLKAYVSVTFDECFVVGNIKIIESNEKSFIAMPNRKTSQGDYKDIAHPVCTEFRLKLQDAIMEAYKKEQQEPNK